MQKRISALIGDVPKQSREDTMLVAPTTPSPACSSGATPLAFGMSGRNFTTLDEDDAASLMKAAFRECSMTAGDTLSPAKVRAALSFA